MFFLKNKKRISPSEDRISFEHKLEVSSDAYLDFVRRFDHTLGNFSQIAEDAEKIFAQKKTRGKIHPKSLEILSGKVKVAIARADELEKSILDIGQQFKSVSIGAMDSELDSLKQKHAREFNILSSAHRSEESQMRQRHEESIIKLRQGQESEIKMFIQEKQVAHNLEHVSELGISSMRNAVVNARREFVQLNDNIINVKNSDISDPAFDAQWIRNFRNRINPIKSIEKINNEIKTSVIRMKNLKTHRFNIQSEHGEKLRKECAGIK